MKQIFREHERGKVDFGWLKSAHSFSFGSYYNPQKMGVSALRVINDDQVQPSKGFDTHGHQNMEIISYVIDGALEHKDSEGNQYLVPAGDIQIMSAGKGIMHSEYNASQTEKVNFLQIWIQPNEKNGEPRYGQMTIEHQGALTPLISPDGKYGTLRILQDASVAKLVLKSGETHEFSVEERVGYLHIVKGKLDTGDGLLQAGDAIAVALNDVLSVIATEDVEALWFDLPPVQ